ncbi:MAG TPA: hypothetical protein VGR90_05990 [Acidimicrobiales bacterium]|nr:hypothetical protein [Acidimicrobiales bacterium]
MPRARRRPRVSTLLVVAAVAVTVSVVLTRLGGGPAAPTCQVADPSGQTYGLDPTQSQNASIIAAVAYRKRLPDHAVTVALAAALQESKLVDLDHGDRDSLGLFQQRPSEGWGTPAQILDPAYAASAFYDRLVSVPGWQDLAVGAVAQSVQLSAAPGAYASWEPEARALANALTGEETAGLTCRLTAWGGATPSSGALAGAAQTEFGSDLLGQTVPPKVGWQLASWAVAHAYNYHLARVSFDGRTWDSTSGTWRADPAAGSAVTAAS